MGKMDTLTKNYMSSSDVFADAFNFFAYNGRQVIDPDSLRSVDTVELSVTYDNDADAPDTAQKQRDLLKSAAYKADYKVNLLQPSKLSDEDFEKFHSTLGTVMKFIQVSGDAERMEELLRSGEVDELPKDAALVLRACTSTDFEIPEETEVVNVCEAIQTMMDNREEKGKQEGKIEGKLLAYYEFVRDGIITLSDGAKRAGQTEAEFKVGMDAYFAQLRELNSDGTGCSG